MTVLSILTLVALGLMIGLPAASPGLFQETPNTGRLPNDDADHAYPRWHPPVNVDAVLDTAPDPDNVVSLLSSGSVCVDSRNVNHVVGDAKPLGGLGLADGIWYYHNRYRDRRGNGFSAKEEVYASLTDETSNDPDIWCDTSYLPRATTSTQQSQPNLECPQALASRQLKPWPGTPGWEETTPRREQRTRLVIQVKAGSRSETRRVSRIGQVSKRPAMETTPAEVGCRPREPEYLGTPAWPLNR